MNDSASIYSLSWTIFSKETGSELLSGNGTYCGTSLTDAQRDAMEDIEEFDAETMVLVFSKNYQVAEI